MAFIGIIGAWATGAAATSTIAAIAGGAIIGAVIGGVVAAVNGDNILEGALTGGVIGAVGGWALGSAGVGGLGSTTASGVPTGQAAGVAFGAGEAVTVAPAATGAAGGIGSELAVAGVQGAASMFEGKQNKEAMEKQAAIDAAAKEKALQDERDARRASWMDADMSLVQNVKKKSEQDRTELKAPGTVADPNAATVAEANVTAQQAGTGEFKSDFLPPKKPVTG